MSYDYSKINWRKELRKAPEKVREAILSAKNSEVFNEIIKNSGLHIDQAGMLAKEIDMVMLGLSPTEDFVRRIEKNLKISSERASSIAKLVNEKVFSVVREYLRKSTTKNQEGDKKDIGMGVNEHLDRDEILREIEDDGVLTKKTKDEDVASIIARTPIPEDSGSKPKDFLRENIEKPIPTKESVQEINSQPEPPEEGRPKISQNIFEDKLGSTVSIESEKNLEDTPKESDSTQTNYKGRLDPYREQIE